MMSVCQNTSVHFIVDNQTGLHAAGEICNNDLPQKCYHHMVHVYRSHTLTTSHVLQSASLKGALKGDCHLSTPSHSRRSDTINKGCRIGHVRALSACTCTLDKLKPMNHLYAVVQVGCQISSHVHMP